MDESKVGLILLFALAFSLVFAPVSAEEQVKTSANMSSAQSSIIANLKDYGRGSFGPALWNDWTLLTLSIYSTWASPDGGFTIGDSLTHHWWNGSAGTFDFAAANEPDFNAVVEYLTNGENDFIWLSTWCDGYGGAQGTTEKWWDLGNPDLAGFDIDFIRLRVYSLSVTWRSTEFGSITSVEHNASWEIWGALRGTMSISPSVLNLRSGGEWITAHIELPRGYNAADVAVSTILLNDTVPAEPTRVKFGDHDNGGIPDLVVRFSRTAVSSYIQDTMGPLAKFSTVTFTVTGKLNTQMLFKASTAVKTV